MTPVEVTRLHESYLTSARTMTDFDAEGIALTSTLRNLVATVDDDAELGAAVRVVLAENNEALRRAVFGDEQVPA